MLLSSSHWTESAAGKNESQFSLIEIFVGLQSAIKSAIIPIAPASWRL
jgi:hypothetical protein